jgi:acetyl-CoA carboxylase alpha subunit
MDEFQALEQKVLRAIEIVKREREARATAEAEVVELRAQLDEHLAKQAEELSNAQTLVSTLNQERDAVRQRVEKMLQQMDELL